MKILHHASEPMRQPWWMRMREVGHYAAEVVVVVHLFKFDIYIANNIYNIYKVN